MDCAQGHQNYEQILIPFCFVVLSFAPGSHYRGQGFFNFGGLMEDLTLAEFLIQAGSIASFFLGIICAMLFCWGCGRG